MDNIYQRIIDFVIDSGKRLKKRAGQIEDIGIKKQYLTEEDIIIERGLNDIINQYCPTHSFFSEEEHNSFQKNDNVWIADPISGTKTFLEGLPHYSIVVSHLCKGIIEFGLVYDPSVDELFTAYRGKGAFLNGEKISVSSTKRKSKIIFNLSYAWKDQKSGEEMLEKLKKFDLVLNKNSHAVNLCHVACGRYDGTVSFCKDSFPMFAGALMIQEAGGILTNHRGKSNIMPSDLIFIGGNKMSYKKIYNILKEIELPPSFYADL